MIKKFALSTIGIHILLSKQAQAQANAAYCDSGFCASPEKYCCGPNECCTYMWSMWYLWLTFVTSVLIVGFFMWKYYFHFTKFKFINSDFGMPPSNSTSFNTSTKFDRNNANNHMKSSSLPYMPLNNTDVFVEQQIDENTIQFNLVKPPSKFPLAMSDHQKRFIY